MSDLRLRFELSLTSGLVGAIEFPSYWRPSGFSRGVDEKSAGTANNPPKSLHEVDHPPAGYSVSDQQFSWEEDESTKGLWLVFAAGVTLVILAVAIVFNSVWATSMVFLSLPLCLAPAWRGCSGLPAPRSAARRRWA